MPRSFSLRAMARRESPSAYHSKISRTTSASRGRRRRPRARRPPRRSRRAGGCVEDAPAVDAGQLAPAELLAQVLQAHGVELGPQHGHDPPHDRVLVGLGDVGQLGAPLAEHEAQDGLLLAVGAQALGLEADEQVDAPGGDLGHDLPEHRAPPQDAGGEGLGVDGDDDAPAAGHLGGQVVHPVPAELLLRGRAELLVPLALLALGVGLSLGPLAVLALAPGLLRGWRRGRRCGRGRARVARSRAVGGAKRAARSSPRPSVSLGSTAAPPRLVVKSPPAVPAGGGGLLWPAVGPGRL